MKIRTVTSGVAVALAAALSLAGCASGTKPTSAPSTAKPVGEKVTIQYLHRLPDGEGMTKIADIVKQWNTAHPEIQVEAIKFDGKAPEMMKKVETDVKAGTAPCLVQAGYAEVPSAFTKGLFADVSAQAAKYKDKFSAGTFGLMTVGGKTVGLPQDSGPLVYYYNKAEFEALGIKAPTTATELATAAKTAAAKGKFVLAFEPDESQYWLSAQAAAAGAAWYTVAGDKWKVNVTSPETAKVTAFWQGVLDSKSALVENRWGDGFKKALVDGKLIGTIGAAWEAPLLAGDMKGSAGEGKWAVTQLPKFGDQAMTGPDGGSGVAVTKSCKNPDQAMEFNAWFNTQIDPLVSQGLVVAAKGAMKTPESVAKFYGGQDVFAELAKANEALNPNFVYIPTWPALADAMGKAGAAAGKGEGKVEAVFAAAQADSVKSLKEANLPVAE